jgi:hypothetical protein
MHLAPGSDVPAETISQFNAEHQETFKNIEKFIHVLDDWVNETTQEVKENLPANYKPQDTTNTT